MTVESKTPCDGASLAASVRSLATQAHRTVNDPAADPRAIRALVRRIDWLKGQFRGNSRSDLARWLASLKHRLGSHATTAADTEKGDADLPRGLI